MDGRRVDSIQALQGGYLFLLAFIGYKFLTQGLSPQYYAELAWIGVCLPALFYLDKLFDKKASSLLITGQYQPIKAITGPLSWFIVIGCGAFACYVGLYKGLWRIVEIPLLSDVDFGWRRIGTGVMWFLWGMVLANNTVGVQRIAEIVNTPVDFPK